jgi:sucrose phosphorylase
MTSRPRESASFASSSPAFKERLRARLDMLYGERSGECLEAILRVMVASGVGSSRQQRAPWSERDVALVTYGDQVHGDTGPTLRALSDFLVSIDANQWLSTVHVLPFFPSTSDDGFSVIDYRKVDERLGDWDDMRELSRHFHLMFDLVLNHCSQRSDWFRQYLEGRSPKDRYFIDADPSADLSKVTRPRSSPLLTRYETNRGTRHVWTTFSADQVDLNFAEPAVLVEFIDILLFFVREGARIIRLDAIAYLWKKLGTTCIHLRETHQVVKVMRDILDAVAPHVLLLSETNVPHEENVSYFGKGDEAHLVYQFSLPPLLLDAFLSEDTEPLRQWLKHLAPPPSGATFFNFTASHDGIGVRPLEGLVSPARIQRLADVTRRRKGYLGTKRNPDGSDSPYELNISYVDALGDGLDDQPDLHARRFLASQAVMLALPGIPAVYFHSLVGSRNDVEAAETTGVPRRINRHRYQRDDLDAAIRREGSLQKTIFEGYRHLLKTRICQTAFHPDASCEVLEFENDRLFGFLRTSQDAGKQVLVVLNVSPNPQQFEVDRRFQTNLLTNETVSSPTFQIEPFDVIWLTGQSESDS